MNLDQTQRTILVLLNKLESTSIKDLRTPLGCIVGRPLKPKEIRVMLQALMNAGYVHISDDGKWFWTSDAGANEIMKTLASPVATRE
jgi:hypothetical protein